MNLVAGTTPGEEVKALPRRLASAATLLVVPMLVTSACRTESKIPVSYVPDDMALRPYVHFVRLVVEGTGVPPDTADIPFAPEPVPSLFSSQQQLDLVFYMEADAQGSVSVVEDEEDGTIAFSHEWHFSDETGIAHSNLLRPPGVTLRENHIRLGSFTPGVSALRIAVENELEETIYFTVQ